MSKCTLRVCTAMKAHLRFHHHRVPDFKGRGPACGSGRGGTSAVGLGAGHPELLGQLRLRNLTLLHERHGEPQSPLLEVSLHPPESAS